jgi:hypothetical protein
LDAPDGIDGDHLNVIESTSGRYLYDIGVQVQEAESSWPLPKLPAICEGTQEEAAVDERNYGENFKSHFLDQYKLYVQTADNISARRSQTNQFYVSLLSALLGIITIASAVVRNQDQSLGGLQKAAYLAISVLGLFVCLIWFANIRSYRQLNSGKFKVIHEMEQSLPYRCFDREWEILGSGKQAKVYVPLTHVEQYIPGLLAFPFLAILVYIIYRMFAG